MSIVQSVRAQPSAELHRSGRPQKQKQPKHKRVHNHARQVTNIAHASRKAANPKTNNLNVQKLTQHANEAAREIRQILHIGAYADHTGASGRITSSVASSVARSQFLLPLAQIQPVVAKRSYETEFDFRQHVPSVVSYSESVDAGSDTSIGMLNTTESQYASSSFGRKSGNHGEAALLLGSTFEANQNTPAAVKWYRTKREGGSDALFLTPGVALIRDNMGRLVQPRLVDVISAAPVSASHDAMRTRATHILNTFASSNTRIIVLDQLCSNSNTSARVWCELLALADAPFKNVFERVVFAVPGEAWEEFGSAWEMRRYEEELEGMLMSGDEDEGNM